MASLAIPTATVFEPLCRPCRHKGAKGGRASGKSHFFGGLAVELAYSFPGIRIACLREVQKSLRLSSKLLIEDKIEEYGMTDYFDIVDREIRGPRRTMITFQGMSDHTAESIKSLEGFDVFWFEEAQVMTQRSLDLLIPTARPTEHSKLKEPELWFGWNPRFPTDPVDMFFKDNPPESVCVTANWRDNPWFPEVLRRQMEWDRRRDPEKFAHVWEGGYLMRSDARVFNNWTVAEFDIPDNADFYLGADWGFSVDPTVLVRCHIDHDARKLFVDYEAYDVGCEVDHIPRLFDGLIPDSSGWARRWPITADSARPETISYVRRHGYPKIRGAKKGPGSLEDGIEFVKSYDIVVHPRCTHVIDELTHYSYKVDKYTEEVLPVLEDKKNHVIDAIRYAVEGVMRKIMGSSHTSSSIVSSAYDGAINTASAESFGGADLGGASELYDGGLT